MQNNRSSSLVILAHGAGADKNSEFIVDFSARLAKLQIEVHCFNFPYMNKMLETGKRRPPDRMPKLIEAYKQEILKIMKQGMLTGKQLFIAGKSMGGRVATLLAAEYNSDNLESEITSLPDIKGVIALGFPFHPPKRDDKYRGEHLESLRVPTLIIQGERDSFGTKLECASYSLSDAVSIRYLPDGDHSFKPRVKSGFTVDSNLTKATKEIELFILNNLSSI